MNPSHIYKWIEQIIIYLMMPIGLYIYMDDIRALTKGMSLVVLFLPAIALILLAILKFKYQMSYKRMLYIGSWRQEWKSVLILFLIAVVLISGVTWILMPESFLKFPREKFSWWLIIMFFYPLFSVIPQGIIYRLFFFERYQGLFKNNGMLILFSAGYFCFGHIIFNNLVALAFTMIGGLLFAWRYHRSQSLVISCIEHALYGNFLFTIGIGRFLVVGLQ